MVRRWHALPYIAIGLLALTAIGMLLSSRVEINTTDPAKPVFVYSPPPTPQIIDHTQVVTIEHEITTEVMVDGPAPESKIIGESFMTAKGEPIQVPTRSAAPPPTPEPTGDGGQKLFKSWTLKSPHEALSWYEGTKKTILQIQIPTSGSLGDLFASPSLCADGGCADLVKATPANGCTVYTVPAAGWDPVTVADCDGEWKLNVSKGGIARF